MPSFFRWCLFGGCCLLLACGGGSSEPASETTIETTAQEPEKAGRSTILFFGNSLSAGYGVDPDSAFVGLIRQRIDSLGLSYQVVNAGLSGETTAGGRERIDWVLRQGVDIFVLELGGNDGLRGIDPAATYENLKAIIETVRAKDPQTTIVLAGMQAPPNMGADFTSAFRAVYPRLAEEYDLKLIPFLLEGVGGRPDLNLPDGIHPTPRGHRMVAETIWDVLAPLL